MRVVIMSKMGILLVCVCMASVVYAAPLARRMVDMTYTFDETTLHYPTIKEYQVDHSFLNEDSVDPNKPWIQIEEYSSGTHVGTHMDSPRHFVKGGKTIDQLDITHFIAPAAVVDITAKAELDHSAEATVEDLLQWESVTAQTLNGTILLLRTGWGKKWGNRTAYYGTPVEDDPNLLQFPGISAEASQWLVDNRNILGIGIDTLSFDHHPRTSGPVCHLILLGHGIFALENVARMEEIPIYGAELYVMPMKIGNGSGAPTRVIATFPEVFFPSPSV